MILEFTLTIRLSTGVTSILLVTHSRNFVRVNRADMTQNLTSTRTQTHAHKHTTYIMHQPRHLERVKSYAPHVLHVVCDVLCSPPVNEAESVTES